MPMPSRKPSEQPPAAMAPLAKLPVFFDVDGRRVLMAGDSPALAWKVELLAAAGADIHLFAEDPSAELQAVVARDLERGSLTLVRRPWQAADFAGAVLAIADPADDAEAEAFAAAASAAGVPANLVDRPALCGFQFGSIINRSPVVIAISTGGAVPILGQAIRRRIETLLPPGLAAWASLAARIRESVKRRLPDMSRRRLFWDRFAERAFGAPPAEDDEAAVETLLDGVERTAEPAQGRVTLVGAGPGSAELLTLGAVRAMQSADVILFDDLVSAEVLELARREARRMLVGKRGGRASCDQADIHALMLGLAKSGKQVVRLKVGDPTVFGRAGEEIERLRSEGVPVEVVPGITAASAMAAALGISLTHREIARSLRFVTAHSRNGGLPQDLDWRSLADPGTTTVYYMGGRTAGQIVERLAREGMAMRTPAVAVAGLSRPEEARWSGTVGDLGEGVRRLGQEQPVLIGIGTVFASSGASATVDGALRNSASG